MGPITVLYIALASISIFSCISQLFISYRKGGDMSFIVCAVLSLVVFISFGIGLLSSDSFRFSYPPYELLRYQLILYEVVVICLLYATFYLLKIRWKSHYLLFVLVLFLLLLFSLIVPDRILFGDDDATRRLLLPEGDNIVMINKGFTVWRMLIDLIILLLVILIFMVLIKGLTSVGRRTIAVLFGGICLILIAALIDQFIDLGRVNSTYLLPFAIFIFYVTLIFIPFALFINDKTDQLNFNKREQKWCSMIYQADIIVVSLNRMGQVEFISPYFYNLTGYSEDEVIGKDWFEFFIPQNDYYDVQSAFIEILEYEFHPQYFNPILTKNKEEKMIRWVNIRSRDNKDEITGSLSIGIDVTDEIKEKEALLNKLKEAEELIARLSSRPDHD